LSGFGLVWLVWF
jgi:hypothetical protein